MIMRNKPVITRIWCLLIFSLTACAPEGRNTGDEVQPAPDIIATNAFYYYEDVDSAWAFYRDSLGLETVVDYGFAKIMRLADSSYLTLVRASEGMHSTDEPKTVTLSLVTDELNTWRDHLVSLDVPIRVDISTADDGAQNSFVATDPEGYYLRFVRYNPHPNHESYVPAIAEAEPVEARIQNSSGRLSIRAVSFSAYFESLERVRGFYESLFEMAPVGQLNGVDAYQLSSSGFLQLVEGGDELHRPTEQNGMTLSFLTSDVDAWFERAVSWPGFELRTPEVLNEGGLVRVFVGYDPDGIFLEWDTFLPLEENRELLKYLP